MVAANDSIRLGNSVSGGEEPQLLRDLLPQIMRRYGFVEPAEFAEAPLAAGIPPATYEGCGNAAAEASAAKHPAAA